MGESVKNQPKQIQDSRDFIQCPAFRLSNVLWRSVWREKEPFQTFLDYRLVIPTNVHPSEKKWSLSNLGWNLWKDLYLDCLTGWIWVHPTKIGIWEFRMIEITTIIMIVIVLIMIIIMMIKMINITKLTIINILTDFWGLFTSWCKNPNPPPPKQVQNSTINCR